MYYILYNCELVEDDGATKRSNECKCWSDTAASKRHVLFQEAKSVGLEPQIHGTCTVDMHVSRWSWIIHTPNV